MIAPPVIQRGLKTLDRALFNKTIDCMAIRIPAAKVMECRKAIGRDLLQEAKIRNVVDSDDGAKDKRLVLLNLNIDNEDLTGASDSTKEYIKEHGFGVVKTHFQVGYDYWTADEVLKALLPEDVLDEVPSGFTIVGHIAHMNLRDEYLPWKHLIGQVIKDKNPTIRTVVNKTDTIDTTFRFFKMEVLAGDDDMIAEVRESGCRFKFDFSQVYWNSRLQNEHERLIKMFKPWDAVCDVMAGVGPFALPAAKKGCLVYANDLNPVSYKFMTENARLNRLDTGDGHNLKLYNIDGRDFIRQAVEDLAKSGYNAQVAKQREVALLKKQQEVKEKSKQKKQTKESGEEKQNTQEAASASAAAVATSVSTLESGSNFKTFDHFVMNLPASAIEFLDAFRGLFKGKEAEIPEPKRQLPMIHCHCFSKSEEPEKDVKERVEAVMGGPLDMDSFHLHFVRKVAPNKDMFCVSFRLPSEIAFASDAKRKASEDASQTNTEAGQASESSVPVPDEKRQRAE
ncbi:tRNA(m(1)G37)methyltransferase [Actinomortierella wolfii]|nr:tRNA(m(1)G37)methyltransferase [Actinomortierella wolfii]